MKYIIAAAIAYTAVLAGYRGEFFAFWIYIITFGVVAAGVALLPLVAILAAWGHFLRLDSGVDGFGRS